ncbi:MAG: hypothetical protein KJ592_02225 [Nanoarchaeota archaeon]|nr:hypothetical protein [Nanoarchaeota archaeon]
MKADSTQIIEYIAVAVILISLFFIGAKITGNVATETGVVNVTIATSAALNFTTAILDFGSGSVVSGTAVLQSNGTGLNTSWTGPKVTGQLVLVNIGNVGVTLTLNANKTAANFIGTGASFRAMVANTTGHTTSCVASNFTTLQAIDTTAQLACNPLSYSGNNSIDIDFELQIPLDAVGAKTVGIVAVGTATS